MLRYADDARNLKLLDVNFVRKRVAFAGHLGNISAASSSATLLSLAPRALYNVKTLSLYPVATNTIPVTGRSIQRHDVAASGCSIIGCLFRRNKSGPNAATLRTIITSEKRYIPIATPMRRCIAHTPSSQILRVLLLQIKNGYPDSSRQTRIPASGKKSFHLTKISGSMTLNGGRMSARHTFDPSHHPLPSHFVRPLKK